jgi:glucose/arabinose dehydrogenase
MALAVVMRFWNNGLPRSWERIYWEESQMARVRLVGLLAGVAAQTGVAQDTPIAPSAGEAALPGGTLPGNPEIQAVQVATGLVDPINVANAGDGTNRLFIIERVGYVRILTPEGELLETPFLDLFNSVKTDFLEQGLLGIAFHPDYANNGRFFVYYSDYLTNGAHTLAEYSVSADDPNKADPLSARILFQIPDPYFNHNGGTIAFGPDGNLYIAIGDGGSAGDPFDNAQDLSKFHGKILRINVDGAEPYEIPEDNPFAAAGQPLTGTSQGEPGRYHPDGNPAVFAYGLRNPWQFSFDSETGDMYIADVGQGMWEEINVVPAGTGGQNFGWDYLEGTHCYPADVTECVAYGTLPVAEYSHEDGSCSITGIGVSRSEAAPTLDGVYLAGDYCSGKIWGLAQDDSGSWQFQQLLDTSLLITGAGADEDGSLYITTCECAFGKDYNPFETSNGILWKIVEAGSVTGDDVVAPIDTPEAATPEA